MPIFCDSCKAYFVDTDTVLETRHVDKYGDNEFIYYHLLHVPEDAEISQVLTGKQLLDNLDDSQHKQDSHERMLNREQARRHRNKKRKGNAIAKENRGVK
jgi:hypothetical protein